MDIRRIFLLLILSSCTYNNNATNIRSVTKGMKLSDVDSIMGKPVNIIIGPLSKGFPKHDSCCFIYEYEGELGASDNYSIWFSKNDSTVSFIGNGE